MKKLKQYLEYIGLRFGLFLIDHLPLGVTERITVALADIYFLFGSSRRRTAQENIRRAGIAADPRDVRRIAREAVRHFGLLVVESLRFGRLFNETNWRERVEVDIAPGVWELLDDPRQGLILVSGHLGNWEIAAQLLSYLKPVVGITRRMNNPYVDRLMMERKPRKRFRLTPKHEASPVRFLSAIKNGEVLAILGDQHAGRGGMMIDFFGVPASTHTLAALLHLITRTPLCFGYCLRTGPMTYRFKAFEPIRHAPTGDREKDIRTILEAINRKLEDAIRHCPEQYVWAHRRWRS